MRVFVAESWSVLTHYRALLRSLDAEDEEGFAAWASEALFDRRLDLGPLGAVTVVGLEKFDPAIVSHTVSLAKKRVPRNRRETLF